MSRRSPSILFIQGFGGKDLFTGVPPESLWGWRRNIGILVALLNRKGLTWKEKYAKHLSDVNERADLYILRDWRYSQEEVYQFRRRHPDTPMISMAFKIPRYYEHYQKVGEAYALFGRKPPATSECLKRYESGLFIADRVIVRSKLNASLFTQLGQPEEKMVLLPHVPIWTRRRDNFVPADLPQAARSWVTQGKNSFNLLFIGEKYLKKGLFRLYQAFSALEIPGKRLHIYSRTLYEIAQGAAVNLPEYMSGHIRQLVDDPTVRIHPPYRSVTELVTAHGPINLLVCPSLADLGPNVLLEGYQLGTPILASTLCGAVHDLPKNSVHLVGAPQWWNHAEGPNAFTERIAHEIIQFYSDDGIEHRANRPDVSPVIDSVITIWEDLLSKYL